MRRRAGGLAPLLCALLALALLSPGPAAASGGGTVSFTQAQMQFNCTICHEPLNEARSAEAYQENALLRALIRRGDTMAQIRKAMVLNYGILVLANPPKRGFAALIVIVPVAVIVLGLLVVAFTIPRWRRRAGSRSQRAAAAPPRLSDADAQRLAADLARRE